MQNKPVLKFSELANSLETLKQARLFRERMMCSNEEAAMPSFRHGSSIVIKPEFDLAALSMDCKKGPSLLISCPDVSVSEHSSYSSLLKEELALIESLKLESKTAYMTDALAGKILVIKIEADSDISKVQQIQLHYPEADCCASMLVICASNSEASLLIKKTSGAKGKYFAGLNIRVVAEANSKLSIASVQNLGQSTIYFEDRIAVAAFNARVSWNEFLNGSLFTSSSTQLLLEGRESEGTLRLVYIASQEQKFDILASCTHLGKGSKSDIQTKGVITDSAKALSRGLITIGKYADCSNGYEKQDALILSEAAEADAIPNLEINNNNVKCSHGSTIGHIDLDKVFYLMSKGLSEGLAKKLIITGYFSPVLSQMGAGLCESFEDGLSKRLGAGL